MAIAQLDVVPVVEENNDYVVVHYERCHELGKAFCGIDLVGAEFNSNLEVNCVVCLDLVDKCGCETKCFCGCPGSGEPYD